MPVQQPQNTLTQEHQLPCKCTAMTSTITMKTSKMHQISDIISLATLIILKKFGKHIYYYIFIYFNGFVFSLMMQILASTTQIR